MHTSHLHGFWEISCFFSPKPRLQFQYPSLSLCSVCVCVCFLLIHSGHQVRWTYQPVYSFILTFFGVFILYVLYSHTYSKSMDQAGKVANPARGRKMNISLFAFALRIWSRETSLAVPSRVSLLISILSLNIVLT